VAAAAGTPTTLVLPTANATVGQFLQNDGSANLSWATPPHGQQLFTTNGTFTVPANVYSFVVECWGGGGGGGGYGAGLVSPGNGGNSTVISSLSVTVCMADGGAAGTGEPAGSDGTGGAGGNGIAGTGTVKISGGDGAAGHVNTGDLGGLGGSAPRGGSTYAAAIGNFGAGGYGGGSGSATAGAGGGGAGAYAEAQVTTAPAATYTVTVGTSGSGGTGATSAGRNGDVGGVVFTW